LDPLFLCWPDWCFVLVNFLFLAGFLLIWCVLANWVICGLEMKLVYWFGYFGLCISVVFFHVLKWVPQILVDFLLKNLIFRKLMGYQEGKFYVDLEEQQNGYFVFGL
jgi:hypothetical protein